MFAPSLAWLGPRSAAGTGRVLRQIHKGPEVLALKEELLSAQVIPTDSAHEIRSRAGRRSATPHTWYLIASSFERKHNVFYGKYQINEVNSPTGNLNIGLLVILWSTEERNRFIPAFSAFR